MTNVAAVTAITGVLVQLIQAWITVANISGLSHEEIKNIFDSEFAKFNKNKPSELPNP